MKHPDSNSYLYPTFFYRKLFGTLLHSAGQDWFNISLDPYDGNLSMHWRSVLSINTQYGHTLVEDDGRHLRMTPRGICAAHAVTSGYAFNLRRGHRSLSETRFYYEYVLAEDQPSVEDTALRSLAKLPERFFVNAYSAAVAFRLNADFVENWNRYDDHRWHRR